jgi:hypothetical protein
MKMTDSIIHEVRAIREQHAASFGFDLDRILADLQARQNKHAAEGRTFLLLPVHHRSLTWHCSGLASLTAEFQR